MVRKKLAKAMLALTALQAGFASALGLGNLTLNSALNQPLRAEIRLLDTGELDASQVKIQLAAPDDFQRAGVERDYFLTNLQFSVELDGQGRGVIRINTREPVVEPYLNFILEARWPSGRLLREYAVLLDPPTFSAAAPAPARAAPTGGGGGERRTLPQASAPAATPARSRSDMTALPQASGADQYRVQHGDTLSRIAGRHRPDGANVQQTMLAIQRANPDAFIRNNLNLVKSGYVLRLPSADEVQAIAAAQAAEEVAEQNRAWRDGTSTGSVAGGPQLDARPAPAAGEAAGPSEQARLSIASAGAGAKASAGEGSGRSGAGVEALRNELAASQETLDSAKRENAELQSRLDDMERQIATLQRLLSLKDDQLAALQAQAATPAQQAPAQPTEQTPAQVPAATPPVPAAAQPQPAAKPAAPAAKPAPVPAKPGLVEQISGNPAWLAGAAALVLALLGLAVARRRKAAAEERAALTTLRFEQDDKLPEDFGVDLDNALVSDDAVIAADAAERTQSAAASVQPPLRSETGDAIAEADIYIAYGRYQQAADLLLTAVAAEPERADLRVKLLEVYLEMRNRDAFRQQFAGLQALGDDEAVAQVKDMLSSGDGVADWLDELPGSRTGGGTTAAGFGLGAAAVGLAAVAQSVPADEPEDVFAEDDEMLAATALGLDAEEADEELQLDGDLDLDFEGAPDLIDFGAELEAPAAAVVPPVLDAGPEFDVLDVELPGEDGEDAETDAAVDFELDLDEVIEEPEGEELSDLAFDLDIDDATAAPAAPVELAAEAPALDIADFETDLEPLNFETSNSETLGGETLDGEIEATEEKFELDLEDDLDLALDTIDGSDELEDLAPTLATPLSADFDLSLPVGEAAAERPGDEPDQLDDLADELGDLAELDDLAALGEPADELDELAALSEPLGELDELAALGEPADELEPLAAAPAEFTAAGAAANDFDETDGGDDFDFLADADEVATKLDLARAYIDMGDTDGAKDILDEVMTEGSDTQKQEASVLLGRIA